MVDKHRFQVIYFRTFYQIFNALRHGKGGPSLRIALANVCDCLLRRSAYAGAVPNARLPVQTRPDVQEWHYNPRKFAIIILKDPVLANWDGFSRPRSGQDTESAQNVTALRRYLQNRGRGLALAKAPIAPVDAAVPAQSGAGTRCDPID